MSPTHDYLLSIALGPVQDFISQARRSRDLWYGSRLLSELSRAVARSLSQDGCRLIFPAFDPDSEHLLPDPRLEGCILSDQGREDVDQPAPRLAVVNKILALVPDPQDPARVASRARAAAKARLKELADDTLKELRQATPELRTPEVRWQVWDEQLDTFLEFAAAWTPCQRDKVQESRGRLEKALSGRKQLRDFAPWRASRAGAPRSALDPSREAIVGKPEAPRGGAENGENRRLERAGIAPGEPLDAISLLKRLGGQPGQFLPVPYVALAPWLAAACAHFASADKTGTKHPLFEIERACEEAGLGRIWRPDTRCVQDATRYDGPEREPWAEKRLGTGVEAQVFYPDRWKPLLKEAAEEGASQPMDPKEWGKEYVRPILSAMNDPYPYVACLVADGDRMGKALEQLEPAEALRDISKALSAFAGQALKIVEQDFHGCLIYAGGDDVLAFVSLPDALACADALQAAFSGILKEALERHSVDMGAGGPTLSVGLGIGHHLMDLGELLELGRDAERLAKGGNLPESQTRNALGIILEKRTGGRLEWRERWPENPLKRLSEDKALLGGSLSTRKIYALDRLLTQLPRQVDSRLEEQTVDVARQEVGRLLARNAGRGGDLSGGVSLEQLELTLDARDLTELRGHLQQCVNRLLVARAFLKADSAAKPKARRQS